MTTEQLLELKDAAAQEHGFINYRNAWDTCGQGISDSMVNTICKNITRHYQDLESENQRLNELLMETVMRSHLALPMNEQQDKWFDDGTPVHQSGDFQERLYKTLNIGQK